MRFNRPALFSAAALALMAMGIKGLLSGRVMPRMMEQGNALMLREVVPPLESYFADFQEWPTGRSEETLWRLRGSESDLIGENATDPAPVPGTPEVSVGNENMSARKAPSVRRRVVPAFNYLRDARVRSAGAVLGDAWGRPLELAFIPDGPAKVTSLGPDGLLGTADDVMATANIMPRRTQPTGTMFVADREFRRSEQARRLSHAQSIAEKVR